MTDYNPNTPDPGDGEDGMDNDPTPTPEPINPNTPIPGDGNEVPVPSPVEPDAGDDFGGSDNAHSDGEADTEGDY